MAQTATIYTMAIDLADMDRGVYETLALRVAQHPSESEEYLVTRVLAYCLEYTEGITFSNGISDPDEPSLSIRDLTGALQVWIDIGTPEAARLHRAAKAAPRVVVYIHKDPAQFLRRISGEKIHRSANLEIYEIRRSMLSELVARLKRRMTFSLSVTDGDLLIAIDDDMIEGRAERHVLAGEAR